MFPSDAGVGYADRRLGREGEGRRRRVEPGLEVRLGVAAGGAERRRRRVRAAHHAAWCRLVPVHDHGVVEEHGPELALPPELLEQHGAHGFRKGQPIAIAPGRVLQRHRAVVLPFFKRPQFFVRERRDDFPPESSAREHPIHPHEIELPNSLLLLLAADVEARGEEVREVFLLLRGLLLLHGRGAGRGGGFALRTNTNFEAGRSRRAAARGELGRARRARAARRARPPPVERARARRADLTRDAGAPRPGSPGRSP